MRLLRLTCTLSVMSALIAAPAAAEVRRVPDDYPTIQAALQAAVNGDEIAVRAGTYSGPISFPAKNVHLRSIDGPATTILSGAGTNAAVLTLAAGTTLSSIVEGFTIRDGNGGFGGGVFVINGGSGKFVGNWFINNYAAANGGGFYSYENDTVHLERNRFVNNSAVGQGGAIAILSSTSVCRNNVFWGNTAQNGGAIYLFINRTANITNCTFYGNSAPYGPALDGDGHAVLKNCIFWSHAGNPIRVFGGGTANATYSLVENEAAFPWTGTGCIDGNPAFVLPSNGDFTLQPSSPAINAGDPAPAFNDLDGTRNDIGSTGGPAAAGSTGSSLRWQRMASLPQPRMNLAAANCGSAIFALGGTLVGSSNPTRTVQMYDVAANQWTQLADLPGPGIRSARAIGLDGYVYVLGGYLYDYAISNQLLRLDPRTGSWTACTPIPEARLTPSLHELNGKLYVLGGRVWVGGWQYRSTCYVYDPSLEGTPTGPWSSGANISLPTPLGDTSGVAVRGDLFTFGSYEPSQPGRFVTYSPRFNSWALLPASPLTHINPMCTRMGDHIYLLNQTDRAFWRWIYTPQAGPMRGLQLVNPAPFSFEPLENPPELQAGAALVTHGGSIFLIGGGTSAGPTASVWRYR